MTLAGRGVQQDPSRAQSLFESAARQGNSQGAYRLGDVLLQPNAPEAQLKAGFDWLLVAAHRGHALAQTALAQALRDGAGVAVDEKLAKVWFREAADRGNIAAQHERANIDEAAGNIEQANQWRLAAAKAGYIPAQITIAEQCQDANADPSCAAHWYAAAARGGNAYAQYHMGLLSESGEGVPLDINQARQWYAMAAQGDMLAARQRLRALGGS
jgi:TPR repeat protein